MGARLRMRFICEFDDEMRVDVPTMATTVSLAAFGQDRDVSIGFS
jgi:hypothetical protein